MNFQDKNEYKYYENNSNNPIKDNNNIHQNVTNNKQMKKHNYKNYKNEMNKNNQNIPEEKISMNNNPNSNEYVQNLPHPRGGNRKSYRNYMKNQQEDFNNNNNKKNKKKRKETISNNNSINNNSINIDYQSQNNSSLVGTESTIQTKDEFLEEQSQNSSSQNNINNYNNGFRKQYKKSTNVNESNHSIQSDQSGNSSNSNNNNVTPQGQNPMTVTHFGYNNNINTNTKNNYSGNILIGNNNLINKNINEQYKYYNNTNISNTNNNNSNSNIVHGKNYIANSNQNFQNINYGVGNSNVPNNNISNQREIIQKQKNQMVYTNPNINYLTSLSQITPDQEREQLISKEEEKSSGILNEERIQEQQNIQGRLFNMQRQQNEVGYPKIGANQFNQSGSEMLFVNPLLQKNPNYSPMNYGINTIPNANINGINNLNYSNNNLNQLGNVQGLIGMNRLNNLGNTNTINNLNMNNYHLSLYDKQNPQMINAVPGGYPFPINQEGIQSTKNLLKNQNISPMQYNQANTPVGLVNISPQNLNYNESINNLIKSGKFPVDLSGNYNISNNKASLSYKGNHKNTIPNFNKNENLNYLYNQQNQGRKIISQQQNDNRGLLFVPQQSIKDIGEINNNINLRNNINNIGGNVNTNNINKKIDNNNNNAKNEKMIQMYTNNNILKMNLNSNGCENNYSGEIKYQKSADSMNIINNNEIINNLDNINNISENNSKNNNLSNMNKEKNNLRASNKNHSNKNNYNNKLVNNKEKKVPDMKDINEENNKPILCVKIKLSENITENIFIKENEDPLIAIHSFQKKKKINLNQDIVLLLLQKIRFSLDVISSLFTSPLDVHSKRQLEDINNIIYNNEENKNEMKIKKSKSEENILRKKVDNERANYSYSKN